MRKVVLFLSVIALCVTLVSAVSAEPIRIGTLLPYTGKVAWAGIGALSGVELAVKEINDAGGVLGRPIKLYNQDTVAQHDQSVAGLRKLIADKVVAVIGPTSLTINAVYQIFQDNKLVSVSPTAGTTWLDDKGGKWVFRTTSSDTVMTTAMAYLAREKGWWPRCAIMIEDTEGAKSTQKSLEKAIPKLGGKIVANVVFKLGQPNYRPELQKVFSKKPDVVFFEASPENAAVLFRQWYEMGLGGHWIGNDYINDTFAAAVKEAGNGIYGTPPEPAQTENYKRFSKAIMALTKKDKVQPFAPQAYDAMNVIALAMQAAGKATSQAISDYIRKVANPPGEVVHTFAEGLKLLKEGKEINYEGVGGSVDFNKYGDVVTDFAIRVVENGKTKRVGTVGQKEIGKYLQ